MAQLKGSKTHANLKAAFAGESQANRRYLYFAAKAGRIPAPTVTDAKIETASLWELWPITVLLIAVLGSIAFGCLVLGLKGVAWWMTGSAALYSDALESTVNVAASAVAMGRCRTPAVAEPGFLPAACFIATPSSSRAFGIRPARSF